jgi:hypothetical protein
MKMKPILIVLAATLPCFAGGPRQPATVPFVGCAADGQSGLIEAPEGTPKVVTLRDVPTDKIAFYKGERSYGVFAPRNWNCLVLYGSSGSLVVVSPAGLAPWELNSGDFQYAAVVLEVQDGGTSGRFEVAKYASRLFPKLAEVFVEGVRNEGIVPPSEFERGPYLHDSVKYPARGVATFITRANSLGLGTEAVLAPTQDPIRGVAVLQTSGDWELRILRVRLEASMHDVESVIVRLNQACVQSPEGCS